MEVSERRNQGNQEKRMHLELTLKVIQMVKAVFLKEAIAFMTLIQMIPNAQAKMEMILIMMIVVVIMGTIIEDLGVKPGMVLEKVVDKLLLSNHQEVEVDHL